MVTALGVGLAVVCLIAGLFVHPAFLVSAMAIIAFDIYIERKG